MSTLEHIVSPEEVMAYLDGELAPERARTVHAHLSDCATCQAVATDLRGISDDLSAWTASNAPSTLRAPAAPAERTTKSGLWARMRTVSAAAAVIVVVAGATWFISLTSDSRRLRRMSPSFNEPATSEVSAARAPSPQSEDLSYAPGRGGAGRNAAVGQAASAGSITGTTAPTAAQPGEPIVARGPKIVRTVNLTILTRDFATVRSTVERLLQDLGGFVGSMQVAGDANSGTLRATLRVPANRLDDAVRALRGLGQVVDETQSGDDVTEQVRDLEARLTNSRNTERRLTEVLRNRTGRVSDVLEVEREIARVHEEIERMEAERTNFERRVAYATITLHVNQERQATLDMGPLPLSSKFRNAMVDGVRDGFETVVGIVLWIVRVGPTLLVWVALLWWPARVLLRRTWMKLPNA